MLLEDSVVSGEDQDVDASWASLDLEKWDAVTTAALAWALAGLLVPRLDPPRLAHVKARRSRSLGKNNFTLSIKFQRNVSSHFWSHSAMTKFFSIDS